MRSLPRLAITVVAIALFAAAAIAARGMRLGPGAGRPAPSAQPRQGGLEWSDQAVWHYGKTPAEVHALLGTDKRLVSIAVASASPLLLDVAIVGNTGVVEVRWWWIPETGPDVTGDGVGRFAGSHEARLVSLAPYVVGTETYFAGIYVAGGGPDDKGWWYYFDQPRTGIEPLLAEHGGRLVDLRSYAKGARTLYAFVLIPKAAPGDAWWWYTGLDAPAIRERLRANRAELTSLAPADPATSTFDVVMTTSSWRTPTYDNVSWAWATQEGD
ncbi:MAG: hypothetical protein ACRENE_34875 [Polyangiaceae bacterium]